MARGHKSHQGQPRTATQFKEEMEHFIRMMKEVVTETTNGRNRFPDFQVTKEIKEKVREANSLFANNDVNSSFAMLADVKQHFQNQQAGYARNTLLKDLEKELAYSKQNDDEDLAQRAEKAVHAYKKLVGQNFFELEEASKLYWQAIDALKEAEEQTRVRAEARKQQETEAKRAEATAQSEAARRRDEEAARVAEERRKAVADELNAQLAEL